jgi:hypothetical protein
MLSEAAPERPHPGPSSVLLQATHFIAPGGSSSSTAPCAALLLVREEAQLVDLASELETLRAQLNQASDKWTGTPAGPIPGWSR